MAEPNETDDQNVSSLKVGADGDTSLAANTSTYKTTVSWKKKTPKGRRTGSGQTLDSDSDAEGSSEEIDSSNLEEQLTNAKLNKLQAIFAEADDDGGGGLDMDEFRNAMRQTMGTNISDHDLDIVFMKVDTNCDGTVDWDEYLSYMLLEYREKDQMNATVSEKPFPKSMKEIIHSHHDNLTKILFVPTQSPRYTPGNADDPEYYVHGRYLTVSRNGILNFWNIEMEHQRTCALENAGQKSVTMTSVWVTDAVYLPNVSMVALSTTAGSICFYDINASKFDKAYVLTHLDVCAVCLDYWNDANNPDKAILLWGDVRGDVSAMYFTKCSHGGLFGPAKARHTLRQRIPFPEILLGRVPGVSAVKIKGIHEDFVIKVKYYHCIDQFFSCCSGSKTSMYLGDTRQKKSAYFNVNKGIQCFDYCLKHNIVATGGYDRVVRVWNPYVPSKPVLYLQGNDQPIVHLVINTARDQIITVARDKVVRVFDFTTTQRCIQTIFKQHIDLGPREISTMFFNPKSHMLILANNRLAVFDQKLECDVKKKASGEAVQSHEGRVCCAMYNKLFDQLVSGGSDSIVSVWDIHTGQKAMQFSAFKKTHNGEEVAVEITAMTFDSTQRRLIAGAADGSAKIWNFNNGACLREFDAENQDFLEITGIVCPKQRILIAGWNKTAVVYVDSQEDDTMRTWKRRHADDILAVAQYSSNVVATASFDGDIMIWSLETGHSHCRFNANEGTSPITGLKNLQKVSTPLTKENQKSVTKLPPIAGIGTQNSSTNIQADLQEADSKKSTSKLSVSCCSSGSSSTSTKEKARNIENGIYPVLNIKAADPEVHASNGRPYVRYKGKDHDPTGLGKNTTSVDKLLFLHARESDRETATLLSSGAEGWVRAWSIHPQGGLLGQFNAAHRPGETVLAMATDSENRYLFTGDTLGYIKLWDMIEYCHKDKLSEEETRARCKQGHGKFPYIRATKKFAKIRRPVTSFPMPPSSSNPEETLVTPPLLNSFRGHINAVTHLEYIEDHELLVSSSADFSIRLWTICGRYIGSFGQTLPWKLETSPLRIPRKMPPDIRRSGSSATLTVINGGIRPKWTFARNILLIWVPQLRKAEQKKINDVTSEEKLAAIAGKELGVVDVCKSSILGKSYKPKTRHRIPPVLAKTRQFQTQVVGFIIMAWTLSHQKRARGLTNTSSSMTLWDFFD